MINFIKIVEDIVNEINATPIEQYGHFDSTTAEIIVRDASSKVLSKDGQITCQIDYTEGGHGFPDIVYRFNTGEVYGIEVKSSSSSSNSWTILGNSILGSTRIDVLDTFLVFIKKNKFNLKARYARYEDCISDVVVTHSPRYKINLDMNPQDSFFARSGISYEDLKESDKPIELVTNYFRNQGLTAWWISDSAPATILMWNEISKEKQHEIMSEAFVLFPELLSTSSSIKYKKYAQWLIVVHSILDTSLRDRFSAGGKVTINYNNRIYEKMPKIAKTFLEHIDDVNDILVNKPVEELIEFWNGYNPTTDSLINRRSYWLYCAIASSDNADYSDLITNLLS